MSRLQSETDTSCDQSFRVIFRTLTEKDPFPWQRALYNRFIDGEAPLAADLPTGLGKTSVVAIWLIALVTHPDKTPRRLVYVVNRRTVVDQTTAEVERLRERLRESPDLLAKLTAMCAIPPDSPLALSTLRGQFADNREWCADPARPAVIIGTVDMIGSGLLFSRYTCGFKTRPHHAALLGQDALLIHDEAHLEPAFQKLLGDIVTEQERCKDARSLRVLELSATTRGTSSPFGLTREDEEDPRVTRRLRASKRLVLHPIADEKQLAEELTALALARRESGRAVLVFARSVEVVQHVAEALDMQNLKTVTLTGTMRGKERDELARRNPRFLRFLPESSRPDDSPPPAAGTVYLVATSAGEVGVNISADDLVCDLSTYESIAQRFGRVNRFGDTPGGATIELLHPESFDMDDPYETARVRTLELLRPLEGKNASPDALRKLDPAARSAAFSPLPEIRPTSDILFDAWSLTSIRDVLPGRPPIAPYLHGEPPEWEPPETYVAWRREVDVIKGPRLDYFEPEELLADYSLKPHELLRDRSSRVREQLARMADRFAKDSPETDEPQVWLIEEDGRVELERLSFFADKESEPRLHGRTILLPPSIGGLSQAGLLDANPKESSGVEFDVADIKDVRRRILHSSPKIPDGAEYSQWRLVRAIDTRRDEEDGNESEESDDNRYWLWIETFAASDAGSIRKAGKSVSLEDHTRDVEAHAAEIVRKLVLPESLARCVKLAAHIHDFGKRRRYWQRGIGNDDPKRCLAKAGRELSPRTLDDAIVRCSALQQELQNAFKKLLDGDATPLAKIAPTSLVFGVWDSRDTQAKMPRLIASTIRAYNVRKLTRSAQYVPAADYVGSALLDEPADKTTKEAYAQRGFVHVPATASHGGIIAKGGIRRDATLALAALKLIKAGTDKDATERLRRYILGLALVAFTRLPSGYLRQGTILVLDPDKKGSFDEVFPNGTRKAVSITHEDALAYAQAAAKAFIVGADRSEDFDIERAKKDIKGDGDAKPSSKSKKAK